MHPLLLIVHYTQEDDEEKGFFHRAERVSSFRNRNLRMPDNADMQAAINAKYEDGVLEIIVPKTKGGAPAGVKMIDVA
jgi:HSP20 family molecular chaperone IbpA